MLDAWKAESLRAEWWYACRLPVNWKLAQEAFVEQYHVLQAHPQLRIPGRFPARNPADFDPRTFVDAELEYLRTMSDGMAGMVHARDVQIAEAAGRAWSCRRTSSWPARRGNGGSTRPSSAAYRDRGCDIPDLNELTEQGLNEPMAYCFPHYFVLPMLSSASSYRFRPLGPEETLMDMWSLTRFPPGEEPPTPPVPEAVGVRRPAVAAHPGAGLLQPAAATTRPARAELRVHAPLGAQRGPHLELPAGDRRLPRRASLRQTCSRRCARST